VGDGKQYGATDENNEVGMDVRLCAEKIIKDYARTKINIIVKAERILFWFVPSAVELCSSHYKDYRINKY
jgi:hypothetical protein